ncbi:MAG: transposase [Isosphaeraceae bacterium]
MTVPAKTSGSTATVPGDQAPRWVSCRPNWFLPVRVLGRVFRGKYLAALRAAYQAGQLQFAGSTLPLASPAAWATSIRALYQKDWVVYAKEPFGGPEQVLKYLTGYTHRVALSNHRLVKLEDGRVTFLWKDYADGCRRKEMTLEAVEFVRRFALHILPKGLVRIRRYGLLAHRDRGERLALCRSLLAAGAGLSPAPSPAPAPETDSPPPSASAGSTDSDQSPSGAGPAPSPVEPKSAAPSRMGISILVVLVSLLAASGDTTSFASSPAVPPATVLVDDRCPGCGVGHLQTIWQAGRPGRVERQRIRILDSS